MWPILACSLLSLTIIIERLVRFSQKKPVAELEKHIYLLGIIAQITPLLGLLGTVTGMIQAFRQIEGLSGRVNASVLAAGIWEALLTTAFGLMVAIPSFAMYHYFNQRLDEADKIES